MFDADAFAKEVAAAAGVNAEEDVVIESIIHQVDVTYTFSAQVPLEVLQKAVAGIWCGLRTGGSGR